MTHRCLPVLASAILLISLVRPVAAAEICGNGVDDDGDGLLDEGCFPGLTTGVCESPLSCHETGMVSPLTGQLRYQLPADVAPKVPFGPGVGMRRWYASQTAVGASAPPIYQTKGTKVDGTGALSPAWPPHAANDIALLIVETAGGEPATLSSPQGFALLGTQGDNVDLGGTVLTVFWKRASHSSEPAPTVADSGNHQLAQVLTFRNVATSGNPWDVVAGDATSGTGSLYFYVPSITTTAPNAMIVAIVASNNATTASGWSNPALLSGVERTDVNTTAGNQGHFAVLTGIKRLAGPVGISSGSLGTSSRQARMTIALRPVDTAPVWKRPLGERWHHTYMTWLSKSGTPPSSTIALHTNRGQDVLATYTSSSGGWDEYTLQTGFHAQYLRQRQASPNEFQLRLLTGETLVYNSSGQLTEIWDSMATPNKVTLAYDGGGKLSTVTDASTNRRLAFGYTDGLLTGLTFQVKVSSVFTTYHTTSYGYSDGKLSTVTIGGQLAQTNVYTGNDLTQIQDGGGKSLVAFAYNETPGRVARIDTTRGTLGYEYSSGRAACSGKTVLYFNLGNTSSCSVDADCGSGFLCGGKTGSGSTGKCFRGARCLTVASPSEDVITTVTALGPPGESCEGACLQASQYVWNSGSGILDLGAIQDPSGNYTVKAFNGNGLPTRISFGDPDTNPNNSNGAREMFITYNATFPGKIETIRRQSELHTDLCTSSGGPCAITTYNYDGDGLLAQHIEFGYTLDSYGDPDDFTYTTSYDYDDDHGRLEEIDGPLPGSHDVTLLTYHSGTDDLQEGFLHQISRKKSQEHQPDFLGEFLDVNRVLPSRFPSAVTSELVSGRCAGNRKVLTWDRTYVMVPFEWQNVGIDQNPPSGPWMGLGYTSGLEAVEDSVLMSPPINAPTVRGYELMVSFLRPVLVSVICERPCPCNNTVDVDIDGFICSIASGPLDTAPLTRSPSQPPNFSINVPCSGGPNGEVPDGGGNPPPA